MIFINEKRGCMKTMEYNDFVALIKETITEAKRTQDRRMRTFTNSITRSIMALYSNKTPKLSYYEISVDDLGVEPNTSGDEFYELEAGEFPLALDPKSIDNETYYDGVDPFMTVVLEIDRSAQGFNVSASDKSVTGTADLGIHIAIETPIDFEESNMGMLRNEVANAVRHELEHVTQGEVSDQPARAYSRDGKYYQFIHSPSDVESPHAKYLLEPAEIPAHVRGYTQNAKNLMQFSKDIDEFLTGYVDHEIITPKEKLIVTNTWTDWVSKNTNKKSY